MRTLLSVNFFRQQRGAVAIIVGLFLLVFIGFTAMVVDVGNFYVARNELQNAADAGALAGTRFLYLYDEGSNKPSSVNEGANAIARDAAKNNHSQNSPVEVHWTEGDNTEEAQTGDVQRGHYYFSADENGNKGWFEPNGSLDVVELWYTNEFGEVELVDEADLDANRDFINAVKVTTRRENTPVTAFFSRIFKEEKLKASAEAIAYIGFASKLPPKKADQPLAICNTALEYNDEGSFVGRMINSGGDIETSNTGGWTNFSHDTNTNTNDMRDLVNCGDEDSGSNEYTVTFGEDVAAHGGQAQPVFDKLYDCWEAKTDKTEPWEITVLLIDCTKNNTGPWNEAISTITVRIIWMSDQNDPNYRNTPVEMNDVPGKENWPTDEILASKGLTREEWEGNDMGELRWESFASYFELKNPDGSGGVTDAPYDKKSIYFLPWIETHGPYGPPGGKNYGILSTYPKLVQ